MTTIDLLIRLRRQSGDTYAIEMQRRERGRTPVEPLARVRPRPSLTIDWTRPLMLGTDPTAYGRWLGELLFGDLACHAGLREALNAAGPDGTLRLRLDLDDPLQELAWETLALRDLGTLATSQRVLFSRYLESDRGYVPLPHTSPRAVVAVADPPDIDQYGLARPTAERYRNTARAQLADFALDEVQATMAALRQALQQPADLLYLVAHGALKDGAPWLFLEDEHGHAARVPGAEVARDMLNLPAPPRLAVLVSCHSGGSGPQTAAGPGAGGHDPLAALGPRLVRAGVPAVIAMRGEISMATAEAFLPVLFRELAVDGLIDRALAAARREVAHRPDAWAITLFMRLPDGRLFEVPSAGAAHVPFHAEPPPPHYVDRAEFAPLRQRLLERGAGGPAMSALIGMGGSGKSTLARALAHDPTVRARFLDGVLWVTLGQEAAPLEALVDRLHALGDHDFRATTVEAATQRFGDVLQDKAMLLVLDDAWFVEDVGPFRCGGPGCHVLITTRRQEVADETGAESFALGVMDRDQALTMLAALLERPLAGEERDAAANAGDAVGYLPLALELLSARVKRGATWEELLADLRQEVARLEGLEPSRRRRRKGEIRIEASLNASLGWLKKEDPEAWEAFVSLGVLVEDATIAAPAAATLWGGMAQEEASELLAVLREEALLTQVGSITLGEQSWPAYALHDMLRALAQRRLTQAPPDGQGLSLPAAHAVLLDGYRKGIRDGLWHTLPEDGYIHRHLTAHLRGAGQIHAIHPLLWEEADGGGNGWYQARERLGQPAGYLADVATAWQVADADPPAYALQVRYALIVTTLNSLAANVPIPLLRRLLAAGLWSPEYALGYVHQIADLPARAAALAAMTPNLPETLRGRAAIEARDTVLALSNDALVQGLTQLLPALEPAAIPAILDHLCSVDEPRACAGALIALLPALSAANEDKALALARGVGAPWDSARALAALGRAWQRPALLDEALHAVASLTDGPDRAGAFTDVLNCLPEERWADALARLGDYDWLDGRFGIWSETRLLPYRPEQERGQRLEVLKGIAEPLAFDHLHYGWPAMKALKPLLEVTPFLPVTEKERLWQMAFERIASADEKRALLAKHAGLLPRELVVEESLALLEWATGADAAAFVDAVAPYLPIGEFDSADLAARIDDVVDPERLYPLALLTAHLPGGRGAGPAHAILERIRNASDIGLRVRMTTALAPALPEKDLPVALAALRHVGDAAQRHVADSALATWIVGGGPPSDAVGDPVRSELDTILTAVKEEADAQAAARLLAQTATNYQYFPDQIARVVGLVNAALSGGHQDAVIAAAALINDERTRALWVTTLASHLPPESAITLYTKTWDETWAGDSPWYAAQVRAGITPTVINTLAENASLGERLLPVLEQAVERGALARLPDDPAQHLPALLLNAGVRAAQEIPDHEARAQTLAHLAPYLPSDQRHGLYRRALDVVWDWQRIRSAGKLSSKWDTVDESRPVAADFADPLLGLGPLLPAALVSEALNRVDGLPNELSRAQLLIALAPFLAAADLAPALQRAGRLRTLHLRAGALVGLAPHLPQERLGTAFEMASELKPPSLRLRAVLPLLRRAAAVSPEQLPARWPAALRLASQGRRPEFLDHLADLTPGLQALGGGGALATARQALSDVGRWWP